MMYDPNPTASVLPEARSVSVVIPTRDRPSLVVRAVRSALEQSAAPLEVLVVLDGPEDVGPLAPGTGASQGTVAALAAIEDVRLRVIALDASVGGAEARNVGVRAARGDWIAFLDDDDQWLPGKLKAQLAFASSLPPQQLPVLSCRVIARAPQWEEIWPRTAYRSEESVAEYLFCRRGWGYGEALLQTSTLLVPRLLMERVPFSAGLRRHQDWDWLLRAASEPETMLACVASEPLAIFHVEGDRSSVSRAADWRASLEWSRARRAYISPRAMRGFLVTECAAQAQRESWRERLAVALALFRLGIPAPAECLRALVFLLVPQRLRRLCRDVLRKLRPASVCA